MKIIRLSDGAELSAAPSCAVAFGNFDGVHIGHLALLSEVKRIVPVGAETLHPAVWTLIGFPVGEGKLLTGFTEKCRLFRKAGMEYLFADEYEKVKNLSPADFVRKNIVRKMNCVYAVCGYNFSFGHGASGNSDTLAGLMKNEGLHTTVVPPYTLHGAAVSSTVVRETLANGEVTLAGGMLGRPYRLSGTVMHGKALGRTLGFPTANIIPDNIYALPASGVYLTRCVVKNNGKKDTYFAVTNVGTNPTVEDKRRVTCESCLLDFSEDIYGAELDVLFYERLRGEKKFEGVEELSAAVLKNIEDCRVWSQNFREPWNSV